MNIKKTYFLFSVVLAIFVAISSCFSISDPEPLYLKKIKTANYKVNWYYYSHITSISPNYINVEKGNSLINICTCENIYDVNIYREKYITITFSSAPLLYGKEVEIQDSVFGMPIYLDTIQTVDYQKLEFYKE